MKKLILTILLLLTTQLSFATVRSFDGTDDEVDMGDVLNVTTGDASLCAWTLATEDAILNHFIGRKNSASSTTGAGYVLHQGASDFVRFRVADGAETVTSVSTTDVDGAWFFSCGTWVASSETTAVYINGVQEATDSGVGAVDSLTVAVEFAAGEDGAETNDYIGLMAYAMQDSTALSVTIVNEVMWKPLSYPMNGLWSFLGDSPEKDLSGNGFDGTVSNATTNDGGPAVMIGDPSV